MIANPLSRPWRRHATIRRNTPADGTGGPRAAFFRQPPRSAGGRARRPSGRRSFRRRHRGPVENPPQDRDARPPEPGRDAGATFRPAAVRARPARATVRRDRTGARDHQARGAAPADAIHRPADARRRSRTLSGRGLRNGERRPRRKRRASRRSSAGASACSPIRPRSTSYAPPYRTPTAHGSRRWWRGSRASERGRRPRTRIASSFAR